MIDKSINNPIVRKVDFQTFTDEIPEIVDINYDVLTLRITLSFDKKDSPLYLTFKDIKGFRVLDEGNLLEFWNPAIRVTGWIWRVEKGGWYDLEKLRDGFVEGYNASNIVEYLVLGITDCVNVLTYSEPEITDSE